MIPTEIFFDFTREAIESIAMDSGEIYMTPCESLCLSVVGIFLYDVNRGPLTCCFVKLVNKKIVIQPIPRGEPYDEINIELADPNSLAKLAKTIKSVIDVRVEKRRRHFEQARGT